MSRGRDVIVVGAGIVGCATAWELARRGVAVTLLDRGEAARPKFEAVGVPYFPVLTYRDLGIEPVGGGVLAG